MLPAHTPKREKSPNYSILSPSSVESSPNRVDNIDSADESPQKKSHFTGSVATTNSDGTVNFTEHAILRDIHLLESRLDEMKRTNTNLYNELSRAEVEIALLKQQVMELRAVVDTRPFVINVNASVREKLLKGNQTVVINIRL
ncbi:hypothetical protein FO519_000171 [Halicephalobus sp. NKZ332]|nr:hypothetical protein FO519_000171 [Halicephalobus sp. NKZ332]